MSLVSLVSLTIISLASTIAKGISSSVSFTAPPNMIPWSPAPPVSTPIEISGDCEWIVLSTPQSESNPIPGLYPISSILSLTIFCTSTYVVVVISPPTTTSPVVANVSQATLAFTSSERHASNTASEI